MKLTLTQRQIQRLILEELDAILDEVRPPEPEERRERRKGRHGLDPRGLPPKHAPKGEPSAVPVGGEEELEKGRPKVSPSPRERSRPKHIKDLEENDLYNFVQEELDTILDEQRPRRGIEPASSPPVTTRRAPEGHPERPARKEKKPAKPNTSAGDWDKMPDFDDIIRRQPVTDDMDWELEESTLYNIIQEVLQDMLK